MAERPRGCHAGEPRTASAARLVADALAVPAAGLDAGAEASGRNKDRDEDGPNPRHTCKMHDARV